MVVAVLVVAKVVALVAEVEVEVEVEVAMLVIAASSLHAVAASASATIRIGPRPARLGRPPSLAGVTGKQEFKASPLPRSFSARLYTSVRRGLVATSLAI